MHDEECVHAVRADYSCSSFKPLPLIIPVVIMKSTISYLVHTYIRTYVHARNLYERNLTTCVYGDRRDGGRY